MSTLSLFAGLQLLQFTGQAYGAAIDTRASTSPYAPVAVSCPSTPLVRAASGLSSSESTYITARKTAADISLAAWLTKTNSAFATTSLPKLGLAVSGGGLRATLGAAGVVQAFDSRDSTSGVAGIYQSLTYHSALSGGGWMTGSLIGNNWPTVSSLESKLWYESFEDTLLLPENLLFAVAYAEIVADVLGKFKAGFDPTLVDVYGRLLGYQLLEGSDGGVATSLSDVTGFSQFTSHAVSHHQYLIMIYTHKSRRSPSPSSQHVAFCPTSAFPTSMLRNGSSLLTNSVPGTRVLRHSRKPPTLAQRSLMAPQPFLACASQTTTT